jgi:hypothetical protein
MAVTAHRLSKSRFCYGVQCPRQLWWRVHERDAPELQPDAGLQAVFDRGHRVGALARERFPGGVLIEGEYWDAAGRVAKTKEALAAGAPVIFEAAFFEDGVFVAVDVLERRPREFVLCEVKSTLDVKEPHLLDVAIQLHVLRAAGLSIRRAEVMHLSRDCSYPDLSNLFARTDVMSEIKELLVGIPHQIEDLHRVIVGPLPDAEPGDRCLSPYECPFLARCNPPLPEHHVTTLHHITRKRAAALVAQGYETIHNLPADVRLSATAARQVRSVKSGKTLVARRKLRAALAAIKLPVAFLDFETINPAVPVWDGCHPYGVVAVQMSCHVVDGKKVVHYEFLAEGPGDPRLAMAEAVLHACDGAKTVVAYNAGFERKRIEALAAAVPSQRKALHRICRRLVDLLPVVRDHVYHPAFGGHFGLKYVLPALCPGLGYDDLEIAEGGAASTALEALLLNQETIPPGERPKLRQQLLAYCERDTLALVKLHARLLSMARRRREEA